MAESHIERDKTNGRDDWPDKHHRKHENTIDVDDIIDQVFNDLFDQCRKLTDEILSKLIERYEIG